ncbi:MAG: hypothetical protein CMH52_13995 [Myxococcales bacterium]|nr:hypothetical protein [Myxococcales bacterium]|tara:strand:- start:554 stop:1990 length:1437 start_codon:yes stop_codon:yes gene_type:complete
MATRSMIATILRKEVVEIVRDGRLRLLAALMMILASAALAFGVHQANKERAARDAAQSRATAQWTDQGKKNPHVAAHYGTHVFAPANVTTAIDPGVSSYLGRSIKIEAHKRNFAAHSKAQDSGSHVQLGAFSVATILLQLMPLLIIALGYGTWSRERERGTLRQLLSTGVRRRDLFWGKLLGLGTIIGALLVPAGCVIVIVLWFLSGGIEAVFTRLMALVLSYLIYFSIFGALTIFASAVCRHSRTALVLMIGLWGFFCLVIPRVATEVAGSVQPLISEAEFTRRVEQSLKTGIDGKAERDSAVDAIMKDLLAEDGFADAGLMLDPAVARGAELRAEAAWEDMVFDHHVTELNRTMQNQENWVSRLGLLSPFVSMRTLSAGLCGTDLNHHIHFGDYTEHWRKRFVGLLNQAFAERSGEDGWAYKAGPDLWKNAPPFEYASPGLMFIWHRHGLSLMYLLGWLVIALILAARASARVKVV